MNRTLRNTLNHIFLLAEVAGVLLCLVQLATISTPEPRYVVGLWLFSCATFLLMAGVNLVSRRHEPSIFGRLGQRIWEFL
jgi:hypothetical protein